MYENDILPNTSYCTRYRIGLNEYQHWNVSVVGQKQAQRRYVCIFQHKEASVDLQELYSVMRKTLRHHNTSAGQYNLKITSFCIILIGIYICLKFFRLSNF